MLVSARLLPLPTFSLLYSIHSPGVCFRVDCKLLVFVFKVIHGFALSYLAEILTLHKHNRALYSSDQFIL